MKVSFIYRGYESLGVEYLSSFLQEAGHDIKLIFEPALFELPPFVNKQLKNIFSYKEAIIEEVIKSDPDLICFSVVSDDYGWACDIAGRIRNRIKAPIIFGGIHPTLVPERVINNDFIDFVCVGEGEEALLELLGALEHGRDLKNIANIWHKRNGTIWKNPPRGLIKELDSLPFPNKEIFFKKHKGLVDEVYYIMTSRGCKYRCSFCYNSYLGELYRGERAYVRRRSVENVIKELSLAKKRYEIKKIFFADDLFISDIDWLRRFSKVFKKEINLPFSCLVHPSCLNQEVVDCLVESGCKVVGMGVQSIHEKLRREMLHRSESNEEIKKAIELLRKTRIYFYCDMILGLPYQDEAELIEAIRFFSIHKADVIATLWLRYYPKIKILENARKKGFLTESEIEAIETGKAYLPLAIKGNTFNYKLGRLGNLLLLTPLLPKKIIDLILRNKLYYFFPSSTSLHMHINFKLMCIWKRLFYNKKGYYYRSAAWHIEYYFYYISAWVYLNIRKLSKINFNKEAKLSSVKLP